MLQTIDAPDDIGNDLSDLKLMDCMMSKVPRDRKKTTSLSLLQFWKIRN